MNLGALLITLVFLVPFTGGMLLTLLPRLGMARGWGSIAVSTLHVGLTFWLWLVVQQQGLQHVNFSGWKAPFGIAFAADQFSTTILLISSIIVWLGIWSAHWTCSGEKQLNLLHPLLQILTAGITGSYLTTDLFNLYVWFEVMLMSSFIIIALKGGRRELPASLRYMGLNLLGGTFFLTGAGLIYAMSGTLSMPHLAIRLPEADPNLAAAASALLLAAFGIKAAVFPLFTWMPSTYRVLPPALAALMAGTLTKVGVCVIYRMFTGPLAVTRDALAPWIMAAAVGSMLLGGIVAYAQKDFRRILTFHIISQVGYMLAGVAIGTPIALAGGLFMTMHNMIAKTSLFYLAGMAESDFGTGGLKAMGGLRVAQPLTTGIFLASALALAGLPPFSGFWAKLSLLQGALGSFDWVVITFALCTSLVTLMSMMKIWHEAYAKAGPAPSQISEKKGFLAPALALGLVASLTFLAVEPIQQLCLRMAKDLTDPLPMRSILAQEAQDEALTIKPRSSEGEP